MTVRILLAQPPLSTSAEVTPPLGLATLAAYLTIERHEVVVCDLDLAGRAMDGALSYTERFRRVLSEAEPDVVGITSMYNNSLYAERLIRQAKRVAPDVVTVAGGPHFGALPEESLRRVSELDFAVEGEGEAALANLLAELTRPSPPIARGRPAAIPRVWARTALGPGRPAGQARLIDLAEIPPIWPVVAEIIDLGRYAATIPGGQGRRAVYVEAGRGCPYACSFCATAPFWQRRFRVKPVCNLVEEIRYLHESFGYDSFMLVHDLLTVRRAYIEELCDALADARLPIEWMANHRADLPLRGLLPRMRLAGCWKLFMGIESASASVQHVINKRLTQQQAVSTVAELSEHGVSSTCSFIVGFPEETRRDLSATIALAVRLRLLGADTVQYHRLRLWPPAPLTQAPPPSALDRDSLEIEYPATPVPDEDVATIAADPAFFAGYFAPASPAGTPAELSAVELFFGQLTAAAPFTLGALADALGEGLVGSFYAYLAKTSYVVRRHDFDTTHFALAANWQVISPRLKEWIAGEDALPPWRRVLLDGLHRYEDARMSFVADPGMRASEASRRTPKIVALPVDVVQICERLRNGQPLSYDLLAEQVVAFIEEDFGAAVYVLSEDAARRAEQEGVAAVGLARPAQPELRQPAAAPRAG
jgi:radical SAM superfamily enzyme YgiQ (UPF0313 family)